MTIEYLKSDNTSHQYDSKKIHKAAAKMNNVLVEDDSIGIVDGIFSICFLTANACCKFSEEENGSLQDKIDCSYKIYQEFHLRTLEIIEILNNMRKNKADL